ncbi:class I SAM-dependent methyltransferase [Burkholderia sp. WAC0059]|uniref:class I SAM-dependent methyltransferase n=1 Tax=Burkholderia sp. WAC0059 TaxID=2066022 RepID=UPI000C7F4CAC|nr:class I SAM-dependent methyltransferase [Burkholderia sp. WAC0059]PLZ01909.1 class I SAM-dependent methyltransferase [Burkholderia sp. WAC0059]
MRIASRCICCTNEKLLSSPAILSPFVAHRVFGYQPVEITPAWELRDIRKGNAYMICRSVQCPACEMLFLDMRFDDEELASLYRDYRGDEYTQLRISYEPGYLETSKVYERRAGYIGRIEAFLRPWLPASPKILDWGGDSGINTPLLDEANLVHIYDISGKPTVDGAVAVDLQTVKETAYDLIICMQVLEHIPFPLELIRTIAASMDATTMLYLEVPYEVLMRTHHGSTNAYRYKRHWHEHINFFSETSMSALAEQAGLEIVALQPIATPDTKQGSVLSALCRLA